MLTPRPNFCGLYLVVIDNDRWQVSLCSQIEYIGLGFAGVQCQMICTAPIGNVVSSGL